MTLKITSDNISSTTLSTLGGAKITSLAYAGVTIAANPAGSETITVTGSGFSAGATVYVDTTSCATTYVSATSLTFTSPVKTAGEYHLYVYNTDGTFAMKPGGYTSSSVPTWVTASGAITGAALNSAYSQSVDATGDSIVYSLTTGSLPTGLSLNSSTGAITGTPTVEATSTFSITATDAQNQAVARSFSIAVTSTVSAVEYLVVAGGGGANTGGGGAGGYRTASGFAVSAGSPITVTVGAGGNGSVPLAVSTNGSNSVFSTITSAGGGRGGSTDLAGKAGATGGSGGGGAGDGGGSTGGAGTVGQGNNGGGSSSASPYPGSGGGGADAVGGNGASSVGGVGGAGRASLITGANVAYAGGGGGGMWAAGGSSAGLGGVGGGGAGNTSGNGTAGTANTGGGGGGFGSYTLTPTGGNGGSGVVIIRYADTFSLAASTTGSPTVTTAGGYRVYKWTSSGTITF